MGTPLNVFTGVVDVFWAPINTTAPTVDATSGLIVPDGETWTEAGFTESGVTITSDAKTHDVNVEEQSTPVDKLLDSNTFTVEMTFAEDTIANMKVSYGGGIITTVGPSSSVAGTTTLNLSSNLDKYALALIGDNTFGFSRMVYVPVVVSGGKVKTSYRRAKSPRLYPVTFDSVCAPEDIVILDVTATKT